MSEFKFVPDKNRLFTTQEIAFACSCTIPTVRGFARKYGFEPEIVQKCDEGKKAVWDYTFYKAFKDYQKLSIEKKRLLNKKAKEIVPEPTNLEELKRLHPLVTDERCFKLNWWPEVIPNNLIDFV